MRGPALLVASYLIDQAASDPEWFPHPVRLMGLLIMQGERGLRKSSDDQATQVAKGAVLTIGIVCATYFVTRRALHIIQTLDRKLCIVSYALLGWTCIAARNLQQEAEVVRNALASENITLARKRLTRIVGRDTHILNSSEIARAVIETLAESTSDGVIAPLFYMALGGIPMAMAYKAINTLDSMIGHRDSRYLYFGRVAARLDDAANYLPSRLTALLIIGSAAFLEKTNVRTAWVVWRRDGYKHKSPNAGQPESAIAGALAVQLGGSNVYSGELIQSEKIGSEFDPASLTKVNVALRLVSITSLLGVITCGAFAIYFDRVSKRKWNRS